MILAHGCREVAELAYDDLITHTLPENEFFGEQVAEQLIYYPTVTREAFRNQGRVTALLDSGKLPGRHRLAALNIETDRVMICGARDAQDSRDLCLKRGFVEGHMDSPGHFVIERAFVEK